MNIYDVSKAAGVSIATVSRVLNGSSSVSEKTKQKVLSVIDEIGYTPNAFARGLGLNTMQTIGIMCPDSSDPYLADAIYYLERELRQNGYDSILCCTGYQTDTKEKYLKLLLSKRIDAVILIGSTFIESNDKNNKYIYDAAKEVPIILLNGTLDAPNIYSTVCDDYQAIYNAVSALIDSGVTKVLYLYHSLSYSGIRKLEGYKAAIAAHDMALDERYMQQFSGSLQETKDFLIKLKEEGLEFDGIVASDDSLAVGALKYAKACNISVPEQLSVIGYNNSIMAQCCEPELTTIDNKVETLCIHSVSTLMRVFANSNVPAKTMFSADILKRDTTRF
ncbi:LacI family DNA-binding transcriptional regulator [Konateibacter massiliensis]|uniref:LacI family DNA-binding transcriptional regulator n=1 Tax=Konateibacter massiliensis TaxID=2002841 RepID=UPI000C14FD93|nr:LacI family DNA-binding transcriptional regulator [Konateibacter massiliensis]